MRERSGRVKFEALRNYLHAFKMGLAAGSASAFSELLATREEIETVYNLINV